MKNFRYLISIGFTVLALISINSFLPTSVSAAGCGGPYPPKPHNVWAKSGPGLDQITLSWDGVPHANRYAVAYGTTSGNYQYGAYNIGESSSRSYTVSSLNPGTQYYFKLAAANGCASSPFSNEVSARTGGSAGNWSGVSTGGTEQVLSNTTSSTNLSAWAGPGIGEVTVKWWGSDANNYHISYGTENGKNEYGALNIGKTNQYTVKSLIPGKTYFFSVVSVGGSQNLRTMGPVSSFAKAPIIIVEAPVENLMIPETSILPEPQKIELNKAPVVMENDEDYDEHEYDDDMYELENNNVQGLMDAPDLEPENYNYALENQTVDSAPFEQGAPIGGPVEEMMVPDNPDNSFAPESGIFVPPVGTLPL